MMMKPTSAQYLGISAGAVTPSSPADVGEQNDDDDDSRSQRNNTESNHHAGTLRVTPNEGVWGTVGEYDVLCGRGGLTNQHPGNKNFRRWVADRQVEYLRARKSDKIVIAQGIVAAVQRRGGRFLKRDGQFGWMEISDKKAQEKTSQALREGLDVRNRTIRMSKQIRQRQGNDRPRPRNMNDDVAVEAAPMRMIIPASLRIPTLMRSREPESSRSTAWSSGSSSSSSSSFSSAFVPFLSPRPYGLYERTISVADLRDAAEI